MEVAVAIRKTNPYNYLKGINFRRIKAIGGVRGQKYKLSLYESALPYGTSAFYRLLKFNRELKICSVKVRPITPKYAISLYNPYKKLCSKWALNRKFLPHFSHSDRFICVFSCNPMSYTKKQWKMLEKMPRWRFIACFMSKIWSKSRKIPYFH